MCVVLIHQGQVSLRLVCVCRFDPPGTGIITTGVCVCRFDPPGTGIIMTGVCVVLIRQGQVSLLLVCVVFIRLGQVSLLLVCVSFLSAWDSYHYDWCVCRFDPPLTGIITTGVCCFDPPGTGIITTGVCVVLIRQGQLSLRLLCVCVLF